MTIEEAIRHYEESERINKELAKNCVSAMAKNHNLDNAEKCRQMIEWLRELQDRRAEPEIAECYECKHYIPVSQTSNSWGKCSIHSSPTEKQRTCQSCDYCSWAERRTDE